MNILYSIKASVKKNPNLWLVLWILVLLNIFTLLALSSKLSALLIIILLLLGLVGIAMIKSLNELPYYKPTAVTTEVKEKIDDLMAEVRPLCDEVFTRKIDNFTGPLLTGLNNEFGRGLSWLWEDDEEFILQVEEGISRTRSTLNLVDTLSDQKCKMINQLNKDTEILQAVVDTIRTSKEKNDSELEQLLQNKIDELRTGLGKEKDIFYDYMSKLILEQVKDNDDLDITDYFNSYKLAEQFGVIMDKSIETHMIGFEESVTKEVENFVADVVGKLQNNMLKLTNTFKEMLASLEILVEECRQENVLILRRMNECRAQLADLQEQSGNIMVTLAWQDIMVEKRWQEIIEKLYIIKDNVIKSVDDDVIKYVNEIVQSEIPGVSAITFKSEEALLHKALVDAELIYQLFTGEKLLDIIDNGVNALLYFIRPIEFFANQSLKLTMEGLKRRKTVKDEIKAGKYNEVFSKIKQVVKEHNADLVHYLEGVYPKDFYAFCNNPYIKQRPANSNQAAWMVFMELIDNKSDKEELYFLVGIFLAIHQLRNKHINPLKSIPVSLEDPAELQHVRYLCYQAISIMLSNQVDGVIKLSSRYSE
ncbi:MAG: hypothetical protein PHT79_06270 [Syntrophomonadaceae bacterium]|nr:hypothetical protein [Syntrophomonadaceae bacterium]